MVGDHRGGVAADEAWGEAPVVGLDQVAEPALDGARASRLGARRSPPRGRPRSRASGTWVVTEVLVDPRRVDVEVAGAAGLGPCRELAEGELHLRGREDRVARPQEAACLARLAPARVRACRARRAGAVAAAGATCPVAGCAPGDGRSSRYRSVRTPIAGPVSARHHQLGATQRSIGQHRFDASHV